MPRVHIMGEAARKLLARSRNLFPARIVPPSLRAVIPLRVVLPDVLIDASIDIMEPLFFGSGEERDVQFKYRSGIPASTAFGMIWFPNEQDLIFDRNELTGLEAPSYSFSPASPASDMPAAFRDGVVTMRAPVIPPEDADGMEDYAGRIIIFQE